MLQVEDITKNVEGLVAELRKEGVHSKIFSDLIDGEGNQYVDLVQEGGGVLGVALVGYTYIMEEMGIRFYGLGGTSAGAINTLLLAACGNLKEKKSIKILETLSRTNLYDFVDGPAASKELIKSFIENGWFPFKLLWALLSLKYFLTNKGLNPGNKFYQWIEEILHANKISTQNDLEKLRMNPDDLRIREGVKQTLEGLKPKVKIVAAEITTETRIIFPEMNELFWANITTVNPAEYVRASMSIPGFFLPHNIRVQENVDKKLWNEKAGYTGEIPDEAVFVDGGVMSNFPIDLFHKKDRIPRMPTFGVKLNNDRNKKNSIDPVTNFLMSIFNSSRHVLDYQFLLQHEDYKHLITKVSLDNHNWLNFNLKDAEKLELFEHGANAAAEFLRTFNWENYKNIRAGND